MTIYLAGPSAAWKHCREIMECLRGWGHTISYDWTGDVEHAPSRNPSIKDMAGFAATDLYQGVDKADLVICVVAGAATIGAWFEVAWAARGGIPAYYYVEDPAVLEYHLKRNPFIQAPGTQIITTLNMFSPQTV